jgi:hypothetical protein
LAPASSYLRNAQIWLFAICHRIVAAIISLEVVRKHFVNEVEWRSIQLAQRDAYQHVLCFLDNRGVSKPGHSTKSVQRPDSVEYHAFCECGWVQGDPVDRTAPLPQVRMSAGASPPGRLLSGSAAHVPG